MGKSMGKMYSMADNLRDGVCDKCFSFTGKVVIEVGIPHPYPICESTVHPMVGYCTHGNQKPSRASNRPPKSKPKSIKKIMVKLSDGRLVEQAHFNDYLKQLKSERKGK